MYEVKCIVDQKNLIKLLKEKKGKISQRFNCTTWIKHEDTEFFAKIKNQVERPSVRSLIVIQALLKFSWKYRNISNGLIMLFNVFLTWVNFEWTHLTLLDGESFDSVIRLLINGRFRDLHDLCFAVCNHHVYLHFFSSKITNSVEL